MPVTDSITRIINAVTQIKTILINKGISVPTDAKVDEIEPYIAAAKTCYVGTADPTTDLGNDGDVYIKKG